MHDNSEHALENGRSLRRQELLSLAAKLFAERGYGSTTVRDIAKAADMLSGSLYYHFKSKDAIIDEILRAFLDPLFAEYRTAVTADSSPRRMLEALVMASFRAIAANRWAVEIYQKEGRWLSTNPEFSYIKDRNREFREIWMGVFESGLVQGWFRSDIDADQYFRFVRDSVWLSARWFGDDDGEKFREVGRMYLTMILDGLVIRR